jgi:hypothetical protein
VRIRLGDEKQEARIREGFFVVTFDDVPFNSSRRRVHWPARPEVEEWIRTGDDSD